MIKKKSKNNDVFAKIIISKIDKNICKIKPCDICNMENFINNSWKTILIPEFQKLYFTKIKNFLHNSKKFYPPIDKIFSFTNNTQFDQIKVVILCQDPYHGNEEANGLAFSTNGDIKLPPTLRNIICECKNNCKIYNEDSLILSGNLLPWASQEVLLLNSHLTVEDGIPGSHRSFGWSIFTKRIITKISEELENVVFMLWGESAHKFSEAISKEKHLILCASHPNSFEMSNFFGKNHFFQANEYLEKNGKNSINWL